ncbi:MAG: NUDIX hydrolase [Magnetococcales bacterium]|nr:NUDIX hydrolase [Magnetococcales bacterium]
MVRRGAPNDGFQLLLVRLTYRDHRGGKWAFPGGFVDAGEAVENALRREVSEEIGIELRQWRQVAVVPCLQQEFPNVGFLYLCEAWDGEPRCLSHELSEALWVGEAEFCRISREQRLAYPLMSRQVDCLGWTLDEEPE